MYIAERWYEIVHEFEDKCSNNATFICEDKFVYFDDIDFDQIHDIDSVLYNYLQEDLIRSRIAEDARKLEELQQRAR